MVKFYVAFGLINSQLNLTHSPLPTLTHSLSSTHPLTLALQYKIYQMLKLHLAVTRDDWPQKMGLATFVTRLDTTQHHSPLLSSPGVNGSSKITLKIMFPWLASHIEFWLDSTRLDSFGVHAALGG